MSDSNNKLQIIRGHEDQVLTIGVSQGLLVSGGRDKKIRIWELESGNLKRTLTGHTDSVECLYVGNGKIVSSGKDGTVKIWSLESGNLLESMDVHDSLQVHSLVYFNNLVICGLREGSIEVLDIDAGKSVRILSGHKMPVYSLTLTPKYLISGSAWDGQICVWDRESWDVVHKLMQKDTIYALTCNDHVLASAGKDDTLRIYDLAGFREKQVIEPRRGSIYSVAVSDDLIAGGTDDGTIALWNIGTGEECGSVRMDEGDAALALCFSDRKLVCGLGGGDIAIWRF